MFLADTNRLLCNLAKLILRSHTCLFLELVSYRNASHVLQSIRLLFYQVEKNTVLNIISRCCYVVVNVVLYCYLLSYKYVICPL